MAEAERPAPDPLAGLAIGLAVNAAVQSTVTSARQGAALSDCLARLKRVERRVDALVRDCDARFEAVAARLDALPAAATADPLAVPPSATASRGRGNAGESAGGSAGEAAADEATATRGQGRPRPGPTQAPRTSRGQGVVGEQAAAQRPRDPAPRDHRRDAPDAPADHSRQSRPAQTSPLQQPDAWGEAVAQAVNDLLAQTQRRGHRGEAAAQRAAGQGARQNGRQGEAATQRANAASRPDNTPQRRTQAHAADQLARALGTGLGQTLRRALDPRTQARHAVNVATAVPQAAVTGAVALAQQLGALGAWVADTAQTARPANAPPPARHTRAQHTHRPAPSAQSEHTPTDRQNAEPPARPTPRAPSRLLGGQGERAASSAPGDSSTPSQHRPPVAAPERVSAQPVDTDPLEALNRQLIDQAWLRGVDLR